jgi:hypothetical protein
MLPAEGADSGRLEARPPRANRAYPLVSGKSSLKLWHEVYGDLALCRELVARKYDGSQQRKQGQPKTAAEIAALVVGRMSLGDRFSDRTRSTSGGGWARTYA